MSEDLRPRTVQHRRCQPLHTIYGLVALLAGAAFAGAHALTHRMSARIPKAPQPDA